MSVRHRRWRELLDTVGDKAALRIGVEEITVLPRATVRGGLVPLDILQSLGFKYHIDEPSNVRGELRIQ